MTQSLAVRTRKIARERAEVISAVLNHPLNRGGKVRALRDYVVWNLARFSLQARHVVSLPEGLEIIVGKGDQFATAAYVNFVGDFEEMMFLAHVLRPGETFADVGANAGLYSLWVSRISGARSIALEPVPSTYDTLRKNVRLNDLDDLVEPIRTAAGDTPGSVLMTSGIGGMNHIVQQAGAATVETPVRRLDEMFAGREPFAMKMDVKGFELRALQGAEPLLRSGALKAFTIELQDATLNRYGIAAQDVRRFIETFGYVAHTYEPFARALTPLARATGLNMIYVRQQDIELVQGRLREARRITLPNYPQGV
jgi:FkbM family methyltransferase